MSEREQQPRPGAPAEEPQRTEDRRQQTSPGLRPEGRQHPGGPPPAAPGTATWDTGSGPAPATVPPYSTSPVPVRRADPLAGLLLLLAGAAAGVSLFLRWLPGVEQTGLDLTRRGLDELGQGVDRLVDTGFWQPPAVVLAGAALAVLGLLVLVPARSHRFLGVLALLVSLVAAAAVLVPLADAGFDAAAFDIGFWLAVAVAVLGFLGALKAMLTGPRER